MHKTLLKVKNKKLAELVENIINKMNKNEILQCVQSESSLLAPQFRNPELVMNLNNGNDIFTLTDPNDNVVITFDITVLSGNPDESYTRYPDLEGVDFVQHNADTPSGLLYSPGTKIDGTNF